MLRDATSRCWSVSRNRTTRGGTGRRLPRLRDYENEDRILINTAEIAKDDGDDVDSTPDNNDEKKMMKIKNI